MATAEEKYTFTKAYGDHKVGDTITKKQAADEFDAMAAAGAFEPAITPPTPAETITPVDMRLIDIASLTDDQVRQLQMRLATQMPPPAPLNVETHKNDNGTITQGIG